MKVLWVKGDLEMEKGCEEYSPLFETREGKGRSVHRVYAASMLLSISALLIYRTTFFFTDEEEDDSHGFKYSRLRSWGWIGITSAEMWFALYWILGQSLRWNRVHRITFKDRLSLRYEEKLPAVDVFVCTADPVIEPPLMVINTVVSAMAYDYPPEKLAVYLSDDGGSELTFYAMWEASMFAKQWLPYCRDFNVQPRSPAAYFANAVDFSHHPTALNSIKTLYEDMAKRVEESSKLGRVPKEVRGKHNGFSEWDSYSSKHDHHTILQILLDGRMNDDAKDAEGKLMPKLVYLAREKRPQLFHNFKAGAMNSLIRVSSMISNAPIILNVDCDMYSNDSQSIRDVMCFFMDEKKSQDIAFVQFPQDFENITKNDVYGCAFRINKEVETQGLDGTGGPCYIGSGCFHRRDVLCGRKYTSQDHHLQWETMKNGDDNTVEASLMELEQCAKEVANCTYELNTQWGKEMGLKYRCAVEDIIIGFLIQCRGWKSVYFNPRRAGFLGTAPISLIEALVQHKRWGEGTFQIFLSRHCPLWFGLGKMSFLHQLGYVYYCFWCCNCLASLFFSSIPSLFLINGVPLFPKVSSPWILPFVYIVIANNIYSQVEFQCVGGTVLGWWNEQRIWLYRYNSSYLFAFVDSILKQFGFSDMKFVITAKVAEEDVAKRYAKEKIEFGVSSPLITILATIALVNLFALAIVVKRLATGEMLVGKMGLQVVLCGALVAINLPMYEALFLRRDKGKMPSSSTIKSLVLAFLICTCSLILV